MSKEHNIAFKVCLKQLILGESFTFGELQQKILDKGGYLRIQPGFTIGQYVTELEEDGVIRFNPYTEKFDVNSDDWYIKKERERYNTDVGYRAWLGERLK